MEIIVAEVKKSGFRPFICIQPHHRIPSKCALVLIFPAVIIVDLSPTHTELFITRASPVALFARRVRTR